MDRKALIRQYKETPRPMGVFRVHNTVDDKSFVGISRDLPSMLNRQRFQLEHGSRPPSEGRRSYGQARTHASLRIEGEDSIAESRELMRCSIGPATNRGRAVAEWEKEVAMQRRVPSRWSLAPLVLVASASAALGQPGGRPPLELLGTWRGTSTCTDRVAAPACHDEVVVYEFMAGAKPGTVHWKADKIVQGQREPMYETDLAYDAGEACWRTEFSSPRSPSMRGAWCLAVDGAHLTGTGLLLPGGQKFRKIDAQKDRGAAP